MALPGGILANHNVQLLGREFQYRPKLATGFEPALFIDESINTTLALSSIRKSDPENFVIAGTAVPTVFDPDVDRYYLYTNLEVQLSFSTGNTTFGLNNPTVAPPLSLLPDMRTVLSNVVRFDINNVVNVPAASGFQVTFRYLVMNGDYKNPWAVGREMGYPMLANIGFSYGPPKTSGAVLTDPPAVLRMNAVIPPPGDTIVGVWARPLFAKSVKLYFEELGIIHNLAGLGGRLDISFLDAFGNRIGIYSYSAPFTGPVDLVWPGNAYYLMVNAGKVTGTAGNDYLVVWPMHTLTI